MTTRVARGGSLPPGALLCRQTIVSSSLSSGLALATGQIRVDKKLVLTFQVSLHWLHLQFLLMSNFQIYSYPIKVGDSVDILPISKQN